MNFDKNDWDFALARLHTVIESLGADYQILMTKNVGGDNEVDVSPKEKACSGKLMIRRRPNSVDNVIETRIAVVGNVDAGKSTMLGVLVKGGLDDGRGKARVNLFRHKHEIESGRTSSVGMRWRGAYRFSSAALLRRKLVVAVVPCGHAVEQCIEYTKTTKDTAS